MKNSDFIKAKAEFVCAADVGAASRTYCLQIIKMRKAAIAWFQTHVLAT